MVTLTLRSGRLLKPYPACDSHIPVMMATGPLTGVLANGVKVQTAPLPVQDALPGSDPNKATEHEKWRTLVIYRRLRERGHMPAKALDGAASVIAQCCVDSLLPPAGDLPMALGFARMSAYLRDELRPVVDRWVAQDADRDVLLKVQAAPLRESRMAVLNQLTAKIREAQGGGPLPLPEAYCGSCGGRGLMVDGGGVYTCVSPRCGRQFSYTARGVQAVVGGGGGSRSLPGPGGPSYVLVEPVRPAGATYLSGAVADALVGSAGEPVVGPGRVCGPMDGPGDGERSWHCWPPACTRTVECPLDTGR